MESLEQYLKEKTKNAPRQLDELDKFDVKVLLLDYLTTMLVAFDNDRNMTLEYIKEERNKLQDEFTNMAVAGGYPLKQKQTT